MNIAVVILNLIKIALLMHLIYSLLEYKALNFSGECKIKRQTIQYSVTKDSKPIAIVKYKINGFPYQVNNVMSPTTPLALDRIIKNSEDFIFSELKMNRTKTHFIGEYKEVK